MNEASASEQERMALLQSECKSSPRSPMGIFLGYYVLTLLPLSAGLLAMGLGHRSAGMWVLVGLLAGFTQNALGILMHEASHGFLHPNRKVNDRVGDFLVCLPIFNTTEGYRVPHMTHHLYLGTPKDAFYHLYGTYSGAGEILWGLAQDLIGLTAVKTFLRRYRGQELKVRQPDYFAWAFVSVQAVIFGVFFWATGSIFGYFVLWILALLTLPFFVNRIRGVVEHYPNLPVSRTTLPSWPELLLIAPYGYANHLEHHVHPGIPYYQLSHGHSVLVGRGWVRAPEIASRGYLRAFFRLLRNSESSHETISGSRALPGASAH